MFCFDRDISFCLDKSFQGGGLGYCGIECRKDYCHLIARTANSYGALMYAVRKQIPVYLYADPLLTCDSAFG